MASEPLKHFANRACSDPFFLGYALKKSGMTDTELAEFLECEEEKLVNLKICKLGKNRDGCDGVAKRFGANPDRLWELVERVD